MHQSHHRFNFIHSIYYPYCTAKILTNIFQDPIVRNESSICQKLDLHEKNKLSFLPTPLAFPPIKPISFCPGSPACLPASLLAQPLIRIIIN
ncbi:hypothetical protein EYC80_000563 [Monilinia laxa]|uniref:Uncharacterized protein n=1 Tax=Monilinia laxa TaxID=61186 RepID=A0A5N6KB76_MONLA|nr:hypothetical protein EYC80_000563 [Monilinia laxa]